MRSKKKQKQPQKYGMKILRVRVKNLVFFCVTNKKGCIELMVQ